MDPSQPAPDGPIDPQEMVLNQPAPDGPFDQGFPSLSQPTEASPQLPGSFMCNHWRPFRLFADKASRRRKWALIVLLSMPTSHAASSSENPFHPYFDQRVSANAVLWLRLKSSNDTAQYKCFYPLDEFGHLHVALLDPRTGERLAVWTEEDDPNILEEESDFLNNRLNAFLDEHSLEGDSLGTLHHCLKSHKVSTRRLTHPDDERVTGNRGGDPDVVLYDEQYAIERAIAASLGQEDTAEQNVVGNLEENLNQDREQLSQLRNYATNSTLGGVAPESSLPSGQAEAELENRSAYTIDHAGEQEGTLVNGPGNTEGIENQADHILGPEQISSDPSPSNQSPFGNGVADMHGGEDIDDSRSHPQDQFEHTAREEIVPEERHHSDVSAVKIEETRLLREQQDAEFVASLAADRAREQNEAKQKRQSEVDKQIRNDARQKLPSEPGKDGSDAVVIGLRLPSGGKVFRRFRPTDTLQDIRNLVVSNIGHSENLLKDPRSVLYIPGLLPASARWDTCIANLQLGKRAMLVVSAE